jgi:hypothetical protein
VQPYWLLRYNSGGTIQADFRDGGTRPRRDSDTSVSDGNWHHVAVTYDTNGATSSGDGAIKFYFDGVQDTSSQSGVPDRAWGVNGQLLIISNHLNRRFNGLLDEVAIYNTALSRDRVEAHYNEAVGQTVTAPLLEDFALIDIGPSGQRVEPGATGVGTMAPNTSGSLSATSVTADTGDTFTIAIDSVDWRDRGNSSSSDPLVWLSEDFVKKNSGTFNVTLDDLPAATYLVTSYHIDPDFSQSAGIQVRVSDVAGTNVLQIEQGDASLQAGDVDNLTTAMATGTIATFTIESNGFDPITLGFSGSGSDTEAPLNGLLIQTIIEATVPEPSTFALTALSLLSLGFVGWRRCRRA